MSYAPLPLWLVFSITIYYADNFETWPFSHVLASASPFSDLVFFKFAISPAKGLISPYCFSDPLADSKELI